MLIPIGFVCRTAYQVNEFLKEKEVKPTSFPYDWTITPFSALKITLDENFYPPDILKEENLALSQVGSIVDNGTQLIHHHDFTPHKIRELRQRNKLDEKEVPKALYATNLINKAFDRFSHTYHHIEALKRSSNKISFVRWQRLGHPDFKFPHAFEGESIDNLADVIYKFLSHTNFSILIVKTQYVNGELPKEVITEYERNEYGVSSTIIERKGFDGDGSINFKGDTIVWNKLLGRFVEDEGLILG